MTEISLEVDSALDLPLKGSVGAFKIGSNQKESLEVKYFLTHVGLNFDSGSDEKLLKELAPVREVFNPELLSFDEIMQRDIDDARVSNELIPYILDDQTSDLIKFFPPIVVMIMPVGEKNQPGLLYPKVTKDEVVENKKGVSKWLITRSGEIGAEVFEFEQPILNGKPAEHDLVTLRLNTSKARLVIVDGQHRAMALLALYRNLKDEWSDAKRQPYAKFYEEWTPDFIRSFDLSEVQLPIIMCTIPTLDELYENDYNLTKAARSIFLTLNKTARKVSRSRNILLNDNDLISSFMRKTLSIIKDSNVTTGGSLSIQNIELDQEKQKLNSPIAVTGVSHIYYIVEHLLLDSGDLNGVSLSSGRFSTRIAFDDALGRLDGLDVLGKDGFDQTKRDSFTDDAVTALGEKYQESYGKYIIKTLNSFTPFLEHNQSTLNLKASLNTSKDIAIVSMLFNGQGAIKVFEEHRKNLKEKVSNNYFKKDVPRINAIILELNNTEKRLKLSVETLQSNRAELYIKNCTDKAKFDDEKVLITNVNKLYNDIYTTVAFQSAIICGFFYEYERVFGNDKKELSDIFDDYLKQINSFFSPKSFAAFKKILSVLIGHAEGPSLKELTVSLKSNDSFRGVVFSGEMQPDQWPKFKYLLMEVWNPTNEELSASLKKELQLCRSQVFRSLYNRKKLLMAQQKNISEEMLPDKALSTAFDQAFEDYNSYLKYFSRSSEISKEKFKEEVSMPKFNEDTSESTL